MPHGSLCSLIPAGDPCVSHLATSESGSPAFTRYASSNWHLMSVVHELLRTGPVSVAPHAVAIVALTASMAAAGGAVSAFPMQQQVDSIRLGLSSKREEICAPSVCPNDTTEGNLFRVALVSRSPPAATRSSSDLGLGITLPRRGCIVTTVYLPRRFCHSGVD